MGKTLGESRLFQVAIGRMLAAYMRLVWYTSSLALEPADLYDWIDNEIPLILTFWHGQHFLMPFVAKRHHRAKVMISLHPDADIYAIAAEALGIDTVRGSGAHGRDFHRKGGVAATIALLETLKEGTNVAMTADVPKISRVAGLGVVTIACYSGRPIYPVAIATRHRIVTNHWDRASIHLPFGPAAMVVAEPIRIEPDADDEALEAARRLLQERLDAVTARAEALVGRPQGSVVHGR
jgi:hypothetical protein